MKNFKEYFREAARRYFQTIYLPISITIMSVFFFFADALPKDLRFLGTIKAVWIGYYYSGSIFGFPAWGCHLIVFGLCFLSVLEFNPEK